MAVAVAVVERFKQESVYGLSAGLKEDSRCGEVAVSGGSNVLNFFSLYQGKLGNLWRSNTPELLCTMFGYTVW